jgi:hypothetical protein
MISVKRLLEIRELLRDSMDSSIGLKIFPENCCVFSSFCLENVLGFEYINGYYKCNDGNLKSHAYNYDLERNKVVDLTASQFGDRDNKILILPVENDVLIPEKDDLYIPMKEGKIEGVIGKAYDRFIERYTSRFGEVVSN